MPALERGGMVVGPFHHEAGGGPKFKLKDSGTVIEEEGFEFNIPEEIAKSKKVYTFTGKNVEIIHKILKLGGLSAFDKVTSVKSGDLVICIKSAWDDTVRTITGTIPQILSQINTSGGCKHIEDGGQSIEHNGSFLAGGTIPYKETIDDSDYKFIKSISDISLNKRYHLDEIISHDNLFKEFPKFKKIIVTFEDITNKDVDAFAETTFNVNTKIKVGLHSSYYKKHNHEKYELRKTNYPEYSKEAVVLHEIQHVLQSENRRFDGQEYVSYLRAELRENNCVSEADAKRKGLWEKVEREAIYFYKRQPSEQEAMRAVDVWLKKIGLNYGDRQFLFFDDKFKDIQTGSQEGIYLNGGEIAELNSKGGYEYSGEAKKIAKTCGLITLPTDIAGTNCGNCIFFKDNFCDHSKILLPVTSRQCCALWASKSIPSHFENIWDAYLFPDKSGKEFPLNENGGYEYSGKALETARAVDLITLPKDIEGTNCAERNCMYAKDNVCIHPRILLPITDRMSCSWYDNENIIRPWGKPVEIQFAVGGKIPAKYKLKDWQAENPNSPRWLKKKERLTQLSNNIQKLRNKVSRDLNSDDEKEALTALVLAIMDKTGERIGNEASANNGHRGVTGFTKKDVKVIGNKVLLDYVGKSGVEHEKDFSDEKIAAALKKAIKNSPSKLIFTTSDNFHIKGDRVNRFLENFSISSKNLRGYFANQAVIRLLKKEDKKQQPKDEKQRKKIFNRSLKKAAEIVGHGAATLRKHYLIPELPIEYIEKGNIIDLKTYGYHKEGGVVEENNIAINTSSPKLLFGGEIGAKQGSYTGNKFIDENGKYRFEITDNNYKIIANTDDIYSGKTTHLPLTHFLTHRELLKYYPNFRNINVIFKPISEYIKLIPKLNKDRISPIVASFDYTDRNDPSTYQLIYFINYETIRENQGQTMHLLDKSGIGELQHAIQARELLEEERGMPYYGRGLSEAIREAGSKAIDLPKNSIERQEYDKYVEYFSDPDNYTDEVERRYLAQFAERESRLSMERIPLTKKQRIENPPKEIMKTQITLEEAGKVESQSEEKQVYWTLPKSTPVHSSGTKIIVEQESNATKHPYGEYHLWKVYMESPDGKKYWQQSGHSKVKADKRAEDFKDTIEAGYEISELIKKQSNS